MPIPDFQSTMEPLLNAVNDGQIHQFNDVFARLRDCFNLTEEEKQRKIASGKQTIIKNRISWARTYLNKAGLLESPGRGLTWSTPLDQVRLTKITQRGLEALAQTDQPVRVKYLKRFPEFKEFHTAKPKKGELDDTSTNILDDTATPEELMESAHQALNRTLTEEILATIKSCSPAFFEQLVVDLMISMGYGGSRKEAGEATQYTADGGIDGVIKEDPLGLDSIYLQAKRYTDGSIGRPEIQKFAGALDMQRAKKGVFITTSRFSVDANEYVGLIEKRIVLIDGEQLASLMIQHGLGVTTKQVYEIKQIDTDYFNED